MNKPIPSIEVSWPITQSKKILGTLHTYIHVGIHYTFALIEIYTENNWLKKIDVVYEAKLKCIQREYIDMNLHKGKSYKGTKMKTQKKKKIEIHWLGQWK